jgi:hypothetical protein
MKHAAVMLAAAALAAGCGGSGGVSKADYVSKADAICLSAQSQAGPLVAQLVTVGSVTPASARGLAPAVRSLQAIGASYLAQLRKLQLPSGDHTMVDSYLSSSSQVVGALGGAADALGGGRPAVALALLGQMRPVAQRANAAARAYGLQRCASVLPVG